MIGTKAFWQSYPEKIEKSKYFMLLDAFSKLFTDSSTNSQFSSQRVLCAPYITYMLTNIMFSFPSWEHGRLHSRAISGQWTTSRNDMCNFQVEAAGSGSVTFKCSPPLPSWPGDLVLEPQGESSLIPRSLAGRELPWRAVVASFDIASH